MDKLRINVGDVIKAGSVPDAIEKAIEQSNGAFAVWNEYGYHSDNQGIDLVDVEDGRVYYRGDSNSEDSNWSDESVIWIDDGGYWLQNVYEAEEYLKALEQIGEYLEVHHVEKKLKNFIEDFIL